TVVGERGGPVTVEGPHRDDVGVGGRKRRATGGVVAGGGHHHHSFLPEEPHRLPHRQRTGVVFGVGAEGHVHDIGCGPLQELGDDPGEVPVVAVTEARQDPLHLYVGVGGVLADDADDERSVAGYPLQQPVPVDVQHV